MPAHRPRYSSIGALAAIARLRFTRVLTIKRSPSEWQKISSNGTLCLNRFVSAEGQPQGGTKTLIRNRPLAYLDDDRRPTTRSSHIATAADGTLAPALQSALHRFGKPWYKLRALHIFKDQTNLAVNPALWTNIREALDQSLFFILFASPESAASP